MKKWIVGIVIIAIVCGGGYYFYHKRTVGNKDANATQVAQNATQRFYTVQKNSLTKTITSNGNLKPAAEYDLQFGSNGRVKEVKMKEGERVEKGKLLATLENDSAELNMVKAQNRLEEAKISATEAVINERQLEYKIAEKDYKNTFLYAPISGLITAVNIEAGSQLSNANTTAGHIIDDSSYIIELYIDEVDIAQVRVGQKVVVTLSAYKQLKLQGQVISVGLVAESQSGIIMIPVKVAVNNVKETLKSGISASVEIVVAEAIDQIVIPVTALIQRPNGSFVMKKEGDKVQAEPVSLGVSNDLMVVVTEGLAEGDQIVLNNSSMIEQIRNSGQNRGQAGMMRQQMIPMGRGGR